MTVITSMKLFEITDAAKQQIERLLSKNPGKWAVSLAVLGGGCAGFKYEWGFADTKESIGDGCLLYTSPSPRDRTRSRMPSSA